MSCLPVSLLVGNADLSAVVLSISNTMAAKSFCKPPSNTKDSALPSSLPLPPPFLPPPPSSLPPSPSLLLPSSLPLPPPFLPSPPSSLPPPQSAGSSEGAAQQKKLADTLKEKLEVMKDAEYEEPEEENNLAFVDACSSAGSELLAATAPTNWLGVTRVFFFF